MYIFSFSFAVVVIVMRAKITVFACFATKTLHIERSIASVGYIMHISCCTVLFETSIEMPEVCFNSNLNLCIEFFPTCE